MQISITGQLFWLFTLAVLRMPTRYTVGSTVEFNLKRGDSEDIYIQWRLGNAGGDPVDLTGWTVYILDSDDNPIDATATISDPTDGMVKLSFSAAQTAGGTEQYFRVRVTQGGTAKTLLEGRINLE